MKALYIWTSFPDSVLKCIKETILSLVSIFSLGNWKQIICENLFHVSGSFISLLKLSEKQRYFFRGYRKRLVTWNELMSSCVFLYFFWRPLYQAIQKILLVLMKANILFQWAAVSNKINNTFVSTLFIITFILWCTSARQNTDIREKS